MAQGVFSDLQKTGLNRHIETLAKWAENVKTGTCAGTCKYRDMIRLARRRILENPDVGPDDVHTVHHPAQVPVLSVLRLVNLIMSIGLCKSLSHVSILLNLLIRCKNQYSTSF